MRDRRTTAWVLALALPLLVAGCGDDGGPPPAAPTPTEALWNPCDALDAREVADRFGGAVTEEDGTATSPECRFTPRGKGDPVVDANYQLFSEGLDSVFEGMGRPHGATISSPWVPGADDTRLVVATDDNLYVSGFVQNGDLIQTVDAVDPRPYDRKRLERAVTWALGQLSDLARDAGVSRPRGH
jgi:hypothetical protein